MSVDKNEVRVANFYKNDNERVLQQIELSECLPVRKVSGT